MKKLQTVFLFVVVNVLLAANSWALTAYIPHITNGSNDWTDYLQANNVSQHVTLEFV